MDPRDFDAIYATAAHLRVPLYIHPGIPNPAVVNAHDTGFSPKADALFARNAIGWHYETGIQALRMVMAGLFDRHPKLQIILGHWGEVVFFYLDRRIEVGECYVADYELIALAKGLNVSTAWLLGETNSRNK